MYLHEQKRKYITTKLLANGQYVVGGANNTLNIDSWYL